MISIADACLVVEDTLPAVVVAKAAKMRAAAIPDRRFVNPAEYENGDDLVLTSLQELPELIRQISSANQPAKLEPLATTAARAAPTTTTPQRLNRPTSVLISGNPACFNC
jgi:hypothetical protein